MKIDDKNLDTRCFICKRLYIYTGLVNSILERGGTKCLRLPGHPQLYPRQLSSVVVLFLCVDFCFESFMEDSIKNSLGEMKESNLILL